MPQSARSVPKAPSLTSRRPSSFSLMSSNFSLVSNKNKPPSPDASYPGQRREMWSKKPFSHLISRSSLRGSWHLPQPSEHPIPSDHRLPRLQRARPSTALDEHCPGDKPEGQHRN